MCAAALKKVSDAASAVFAGISKLFAGFTITLSTSTSPTVSTLFKLDSLPLTSEEKQNLNEVHLAFEKLCVKNQDSLLSYQEDHFFKSAHSPFENTLEYLNAFVAACEKLELVAAVISARKPGNVTSNETTERFALRRIINTLTNLLMNLRPQKETALAEINKLKPKQSASPGS